MVRACTCNCTLLPDRYEDCVPSDDHDSARRRPVRAMPSWMVRACDRNCTLLLAQVDDHVVGLDWTQGGDVSNHSMPRLLKRCRSTLLQNPFWICNCCHQHLQAMMPIGHRTHMNLCTWYLQADHCLHWKVWSPISTVRNWSPLAGITATRLAATQPLTWKGDSSSAMRLAF